MPGQSVWRRRRFFIDKRLQGRLLLTSFAHVGIVAAVFGCVLFLPPIVGMLTHADDSDAALQAAQQLLYLHGRFWPAAVLALLLVSLDSVRVSHRIAGPVFRFRETLRRLRDGEAVGEIRLRESDLLQELADDLNEMLRSRGPATGQGGATVTAENLSMPDGVIEGRKERSA